MAKKNIFLTRNPLSNLKSEKTKDLVKKFEENENIKKELMKIEGTKISSINKEQLEKINFQDREFINREVSFEDILKQEQILILAESINDIGLINPVYVIDKKDNYQILSGFRRLSAISYGYDNIDNFEVIGSNNLIIIPEEASYEILDKISLHENTLREDLTVLELAIKIWNESRRKSKKTEEIAKDYGLSKRTVARYLRVEKYPEELIDRLDEIKNIRKADTIYSYLKQTNFSHMKNKIDKLINLEISNIEQEIKQLKIKQQKEAQIKVKSNKNKTTIEIYSGMTEEQLKELKLLINQVLLK